MPLWKMTLPFLSKARAYFPCSELGLDLWLVLMERVLQKWLRLPWMSSSLNMRGHMEEKNWRMQVKQRERERKRKAGSFQPFQKSHLQTQTCEWDHLGYTHHSWAVKCLQLYEWFQKRLAEERPRSKHETYEMVVLRSLRYN